MTSETESGYHFNEIVVTVPSKGFTLFSLNESKTYIQLQQTCSHGLKKKQNTYFFTALSTVFKCFCIVLKADTFLKVVMDSEC